METKTGLNNTQRKMLDDVYMEQYRKIEQSVLDKRKAEIKVLYSAVIKKEKSKEPLKTAFKKIQEGIEAYRSIKAYLADNGMRLDSSLPTETELEIYNGYSSNAPHPDVVEFDRKTEEIKQKLYEKRKEIRARIYGLSSTYEEVDAEIRAHLQDLL